MFCIILACVVGCDAVRTIEETQFPMNTYVRIKLWVTNGDSVEPALEQAFREIARVETLTSHFHKGSLLTEANLKKTIVSEELAELVLEALEVSELTDGAFDPTVYPLLDLWGFYDTLATSIPRDEVITKALQGINWQSVEVSADTVTVDGVMLDLSAIAKGYAVDKAAAILEGMGVNLALIDAGGDIRCMGQKKGGWNIGIKHPRDEGLLGIINLTEGSVATSGDYENYFEVQGIRFHHLMDPRTGKPAREALSATVIAPTTLQADAWATALFVMGRDGIELLNEIAELEGLIILEDFSVVTTKGFPEIQEP